MSSQIKVRGFHIDVYQHVNNGRYMEFLEEARWEFMDHTGFAEKIAALGLSMVVVNTNINYRRPAVIHDVLDLGIRVAKIGGKSAVFEQTVTRQKDGVTEMVVDATVTFCVMDPVAEKAVPLEGEIRTILEQVAEEAGA
ncbi:MULTISPECIES: acyl-CoA thioesterase [Thalassolituus]|jgi:thioesterase-3|uniref:acyl-CoA thioesterase n=1 Tax=Thalassolituus TaxID=187492 RepID=UPI0007CF5DD7|nr:MULTISPECIES: thioesterase family protein [Thalassolituus]KZY99589.1 thioesterase [Oleibacter sp. HI0075]MAG42992.1 acyl-CoA thioesterase [Oceanospirillaceae bacterium]MEE3160011.1 thioesterase family protein [Pseudomonadota bacterium]HCG79128.1 acyl-CoA thioesterase [Oceanospirillales bacterium]|tara:strand:- start:84 stop:500 length:417 start_codon:yes stop_codon:yes gene_type:complete